MRQVCPPCDLVVVWLADRASALRMRYVFKPPCDLVVVWLADRVDVKRLIVRPEEQVCFLSTSVLPTIAESFYVLSIFTQRRKHSSSDTP